MKRISIKLKFGVLIGILIAIVVFVISQVILQQEKRELVKRIKSQGIILSKNLTSAAAEGITTSDELVIFQTIGDIMKEDGVIECFVLDNKGTVIAHNQVKEVGKHYNLKKWMTGLKKEYGNTILKRDGKLLYNFVYPVYVKTFEKGAVKRVKIGTSHILFSYTIIEKAINKATLTVILIALIVLIAGIGASFLLTNFIVKPIMEMARGAQIIGKGNLDYKIKVNTKDELELLANQFNSMTESLAEAQKIMLEQERLKYELDIATSIQNSLIPKQIPSIKGISISSYYKSAKEVGGDYYDFFKLDNNRIGFVVADVSGKGVPGAMVMIMVRSVLKSQVYSNKTAFHTLINTNKLIFNDIRKGMFITAFYGILDASKLIFQFANAGHNPLIILGQDTGKCEIYTEPGIPLGVQNPKIFEETIRGKFLQLKKGDVIVQYTDGITEAKNIKEEEYGIDRLINIVTSNKDSKPSDLIKNLIKDVNNFCGEEPQYDDIAIVAIKV